MRKFQIILIELLTPMVLTGCDLFFSPITSTSTSTSTSETEDDERFTCMSDLDCNDSRQIPCLDYHCDEGECVKIFAVKGVITPIQIPGDCKKIVCYGEDTPFSIEINDDHDVTDDANTCTLDYCENGQQHHRPLLGMPCEMLQESGWCTSEAECSKSLTCSKEFLNCDGDFENGCETPVSHLNCGVCGLICEALQQYCVISPTVSNPYCDDFQP